jgi:DNA-binding NarL/FixJ family response regulator
MSASSPSAGSAVWVLLIDQDPVFRLGLQVLLRADPLIRVVAEAADGEMALQILDRQFVRPEAESTGAVAYTAISPSINLIVLDLSLGRDHPDQIQGLNLCQLLKSRYPSLPILCLGTAPEPVVLAAVRQSGANGYCAKTAETAELLGAMRQVAAGQSWLLTASSSRGTGSSALSPRPPAPLATLRRSLRCSGISQIETVLAEVTAELQNLDLSLLDRAVLAGQHRELRLARWLVNHLLATPALPEPLMSDAATNQPISKQPVQPEPVQAENWSALVTPDLNAIVPAADSALADRQSSIQSVMFDTVLAKLQSGLENQTEIPLETDILREDKKRDLFYLILRKLEEVLSELRFSQVEPAQLPLKRATLLLDLWQLVLVDFFGKYYTVQINGSSVQVTDVLLQDAAIVEAEILDGIPGMVDLLQHLLFRAPLTVDSVPYPVGNPESLARAELLLENLLVQVANAVVQPLLNRFTNIEPIKQAFYHRRLLSSREIERFRNDLSWRYRVDRSFREPKHIFESQYRLFILTGRGIKRTAIYAPRIDELNQLSGLPYLVTFALETRDAVAPRLRAAVSFVGNGLVYVLTEVLGRGIGLIGRGVLKGLGNVWQDPAKRDRVR